MAPSSGSTSASALPRASTSTSSTSSSSSSGLRRRSPLLSSKSSFPRLRPDAPADGAPLLPSPTPSTTDSVFSLDFASFPSIRPMPAPRSISYQRPSAGTSVAPLPALPPTLPLNIPHRPLPPSPARAASAPAVPPPAPAAPHIQAPAEGVGVLGSSVLALANTAAALAIELERTLTGQSAASAASAAATVGSAASVSMASAPSAASSTATIMPVQKPAPAVTVSPPPPPPPPPHPAASSSSLAPTSQPSHSPAPPPHPLSNVHPRHILPPAPSSIPLSRYGTHGASLPSSSAPQAREYQLSPPRTAAAFLAAAGARGSEAERTASAPGRLASASARELELELERREQQQQREQLRQRQDQEEERAIPPIPARLRPGRVPVPSYAALEERAGPSRSSSSGAIHDAIDGLPRRPLVLSEHLPGLPGLPHPSSSSSSSFSRPPSGGGVRAPPLARNPTTRSAGSAGGRSEAWYSLRSSLTLPAGMRSVSPSRASSTGSGADSPRSSSAAALALARRGASQSSSSSTLPPSFHTADSMAPPPPAKPGSLGGGLGGRKIREERLAALAARVKDVGDGKGWGRWKMALGVTVVMVFSYSLGGLICAFATYNDAWDGAQVMRVMESDLLGWILTASLITLLVSLLGLSGTLLHSRPQLAFYAFLLWPCLALQLVVLYLSYRRSHQNLEGKLDEAWSRFLDPLAREVIQMGLACCGYYNAWHDATYSAVGACYPRTSLPGCKGPLLGWETALLRRVYRSAGAIVALQIAAMTVALLGSNHIDEQFGTRLPPPAYRLSQTDVHPSLLLQPTLSTTSTAMSSQPSLKQLHLAAHRLSRAPSLRSEASSASTYSTRSSGSKKTVRTVRTEEMPRTPGLHGLGVDTPVQLGVGVGETPVLRYEYPREDPYEDPEEGRGGIRAVR
ncbi:hypothetical protein JCM10213_008425 [Rhodosporidiobolus nylandii]